METKKMYDRLNEKLSFVSKPLSKCFMLVLNLSAIIAAIVAVVDYFNPDPFEKLSKQLSDYQDDVASLKMVEIPDSLMTDEIKNIRISQQKIIANAIVFNSMQPSRVEDLEMSLFQIYKVLMANDAISKITEETKYIYSMYYKNDQVLGIGFMLSDVMNLGGRLFDFNTKLKQSVQLLKGKKITKKEAVDIIDDLLTSADFEEYLRDNNRFIRVTFDYMNTLQLYLVYDIEMGSDVFQKNYSQVKQRIPSKQK